MSRPTLLLAILLLTPLALAQDAREQLGASERKGAKGPHPLLAIEAAHPAPLSDSLKGLHPRVFFTQPELDALRARAHTTHKDLWQRALANMTCLTKDPAPAPAQARRAQNDTALGIAEAAFAYQIERDPKYLAAARKYMDAAVSYDIWGYAFSKPNVDLAAGHLLYGLSFGYDLLYHDLTDAERAKYRDKLAKHAKLLFNSYSLKPGRTFSYSQNHLFIPAAGLGIASYALYDEVPDAPKWATRTRALFDRVLATYSSDGYYYEGFEYWVFSTPWLIHYMDALAHATGEDLYDQTPGLKNAHLYLAHAILPDGNNPFDFGDVFEGPLTRARQGDDYERTHPRGHLHSNYLLLYRLAQRYHNPEAQGVAAHLAALGQVNFEDWWSLAWYDPTIKPAPIESLPTSHYFPDNDTLYWRSDWTKDATAFAIRCSPPEGHHAAELIPKFPDWRLSSGHAHPDAASFILYANHQYLTGVSGYAGVPLTAHNNTLLIDGKGQAAEGQGHDAFDGYPYTRLNTLHLSDIKADSTGLNLTADATGAYAPDLGLSRFLRSLHLTKSSLILTDQVDFAHPATPAILFHFDGDAAPPGLKITITSPSNATQSIEPNIVTSPGPPGHVDAGPKQQRGTRLRVSTPQPVTHVTFETHLQW